MEKKKRKKVQQNNLLVLKLLILVIIVLVGFEGKLIYTMFTHRSGHTVSAVSAGGPAASDALNAADQAKSAADTSKDAAAQTEKAAASPDTPAAASTSGNADSILAQALAGLALSVSSGKEDASAAGLASAAGSSMPSGSDAAVSEMINSPAVVAKADTPVDDSFFADSVFIGDSRMMGFQNSSGITKGAFLTSVGLSTDAMGTPTIASPQGTISVYQGLSGKQYDKIYLMLGTNDLGYYPWEDFEPNFTGVVEQFHKLQPGASIYVCSVIYVDESKITTSYDNNDNVRKINGYLLNVCEKLDYCHYLNLNEIFSNGYGGLKPEASSDGIHLYEKYCVQMLEYLKSHYIPE